LKIEDEIEGAAMGGSGGWGVWAAKHANCTERHIWPAVNKGAAMTAESARVMPFQRRPCPSVDR